MDITWLGHAAVRVRTRDAALVMDPCDRSSGYDMKRPDGDIVTISHDHPHHNHVAGVKGDPMVLDGPGEYEIKGVHVDGIRSALKPEAEGEPAQQGTIFVFESEELRGAHLGGLGTQPTPAQAEHLGNLDILIVPIAQSNGLNAQEAARVVRTLEPKIVIPVAYPLGGDGASAELKAFLERMGVEPEEPVQRFTVNRRNVGDTMRVVLIESRG